MLQSTAKKQRKQIISALVVPCFDYCDTIWSGCCDSELAGLSRVFLDAAEFIAGSRCLSRNDPSSWLAREINWCTPEQRRQLRLCEFAWKSCNLNQWPECLKIRNMSSSHHTRFAASGIAVERKASSWQQRAPLTIAAKSFNRLSHNTRSERVFEKFRVAADCEIKRW
jgi:hypothetical protein